MTRIRLALLVVIALAIAAAVALTRTEARNDVAPLAWVATARQLGPVSYRDPAGAISPDGRWIAYSEGRFLRVRPVSGGPSVEFPPGDAQIRHLIWSPDSRAIVTDGVTAAGGWALYDPAAATRRSLWPTRQDSVSIRQIAWSPDGRSIAGVVNGREGSELWTIASDGGSASSKRVSSRISFPAWTPNGEIACVTGMPDRARITIPCGGAAVRAQPDLDAYGPLAFSPDGATVYGSLANSTGTVDLWAIPIQRGGARRLTSFVRDSYAPSVSSDGSVVFKVQSYRTAVAVTSARGGASRPLVSFTAETPSWDPTGKWIGITYGTWRRVPDDAKYPDIAQDAGIIAADVDRPAAAPATIVHDSASEDQSLCWSPNGKWIAFHSHKEQSDDLWLRPATGSTETRRVTKLGRGAETGWPRWSTDGRSVLFTGASRQTHRTAMYVVEIDQETGATLAAEREIVVDGFEGNVFHAEWLGADEIVAVVKEAPGRHAIFTIKRGGGAPQYVHRFASEHDVPGIAASPDGRHVAFIAPAPDGFFQVFRMPVAGGAPEQLTTDPSNKTQPAWSPDGQRIAFTVWSYEAQFWRIGPR